MEFSMLNAGLAAGAALAALPVILHLFMRQTPKHVVFPALRLIRERQKRSKKKMRIKNWLLLAARMLLIALMALALARPRLHSETPLGDDNVPAAVGLVFDTSLSMSYVERDRSLLDLAKDRAREILSRLPDASVVVAVNSAEPETHVELSPAAARKWIDDLSVRPLNRTLNTAMGRVYRAIAEVDRPRREVYVLTDLARGAWTTGRPAEGLDKVEEARKSDGASIATVVIRLGPTERQNVSVDEMELVSEVAAQGEPAEIRSLIQAHGTEPAKRIVEFYLDGVKKDQKAVELASGGTEEVRFFTPNRLQEGSVHRAEVRVTGAPDPLPFDDQRFLTFDVRPSLKILLISDRIDEDTQYVAAALAPDPAAVGFALETRRPADLGTYRRDGLKGFAAVFLLNVAKLDDALWGMLNAYVHEGGGLVVGLGDRCVPESYNGPIAGQILPMQLGRPVSPPGNGTTFGKIVDVTHPLFEPYAREFDAQFAVMPVYHYWSLQAPTGGGGRTLLTFADGAPALVERAFKGPRTGRVLLWASPLARRVELSDRAAWNEFPNSSYWVFPYVMNRAIPYLAGASEGRLNFEAGEDVLLDLGADARPQRILITGPDQKATDQLSPPPPGDPLRVSPLQIGQWTVTALGPDEKRETLGFSFNAPRAESQFTEMEKADLDGVFGADGYALAGDDQTLKKVTELIRVGRELFPWLMFLILILVTLENYIANTFYKDPESAGATLQPTGPAAGASA